MTSHHQSPVCGSRGDVRIRRVEVRLLHLPILEALDAAHGAGSKQHRPLTTIGLRTDDGIVGWGECAALATSSYWPETASSSFDVLRAAAASLVGEVVGELNAFASTGVVLPVVGELDDRPMASAAVEMAAVDLALKVDGSSLADWLGSTRSMVPAGATVGLGPADLVAERVLGLISDGFRRVKVKIEPTTANLVIAEVAKQVATVFPVDDQGRFRGFDLHVDANGSHSTASGPTRPDDESVRALLELSRLGVAAIEQPFSVGDIGAARALRAELAAADLSTLVMADESASSLASAREVVWSGTADGVVIKPSRLGGLLAGRTAIADARAEGAEVSVGGMLESGLGRRSLAALAALDGVTIPGDLSPARRWLRDDPWPDVETIMVAGALHIVVPTTVGVAPPPDPDTLDRYTVERVTVDG